MTDALGRLFERMADENAPDRHAPESRHVNYTRHASERVIASWPLPVIADAALPPGYIEMRSGAQRAGVWLPEARDDHDPGDEDGAPRPTPSATPSNSNKEPPCP